LILGVTTSVRAGAHRCVSPASNFESGGREFESLRARHFIGTSETRQNFWLILGSASCASHLPSRRIICCRFRRRYVSASPAARDVPNYQCVPLRSVKCWLGYSQSRRLVRIPDCDARRRGDYPMWELMSCKFGLANSLSSSSNPTLTLALSVRSERGNQPRGVATARYRARPG
jgi:hypothetical protein